MDKEVLSRATRGVMNILKYFNVIEGEIEKNPEQMIIGNRKLIRHQVGGLYVPSVGFESLNTIVPKGTLLGRTISPYTLETVEEFRADFDLTILILFKTVHTRVYPGDYAFIFGDVSTRRGE